MMDDSQLHKILEGVQDSSRREDTKFSFRNVTVVRRTEISVYFLSQFYCLLLCLEGRTHFGTLMPQDFSSVLYSWCCSEQLLEQVALRILKQCCVAGVPNSEFGTQLLICRSCSNICLFRIMSGTLYSTMYITSRFAHADEKIKR